MIGMMFQALQEQAKKSGYMIFNLREGGNWSGYVVANLLTEEAYIEPNIEEVADLLGGLCMYTVDEKIARMKDDVDRVNHITAEVDKVREAREANHTATDTE